MKSAKENTYPSVHQSRRISLIWNLSEADKKVEKANKLVKQMVCKMYEDGFSLEQISEYCSLNVDEIQVLINS